ncbi:MAG: hypothetical protein IPP17_15400 [Bacteroidetes bacterium]|nr:hypothetical protein [Bacteroidota bacterium]
MSKLPVGLIGENDTPGCSRCPRNGPDALTVPPESPLELWCILSASPTSVRALVAMVTRSERPFLA